MVKKDKAYILIYFINIPKGVRRSWRGGMDCKSIVSAE